MLRRVTVALACAALLAGCTGSPSSSPSTDTSPTRSGATSPAATPVTPTPAAVPRAPLARACYRLTAAQLTRPTNASTPVPCRSRHTAQTVYVGRLDMVVDGHSVAVDSATVQKQLSRTCPRKLAAYVGGSAKARDLSRFNVVWYSPTLEQSDQGASWFRCDVIAFAAQDRLAPLPATARLQGVLGSAGALDEFGLCGTSAPGARGFQRVICGRSHSWRAIDTIALPGGARYPGTATVRKAGDSGCKDLAQARSANSLKYRYGWEWPTREQWARGQRFGYCWVPQG